MKMPNMARCTLTILIAVPFCQLVAPSRTHASPDARKLAREHFEKGMAAFNDERFAEAVEEFEAAYRLSPAFKVLYNIGQVNVALGRSVEAVDAFEKYLDHGAAGIPQDRREAVQAEIEKQRWRIGSVAIRTVPTAAELRIDGKLVGKTPLGQPVRLVTGKHTIEAILSEYKSQLREIDVAGRATVEIELTLEPVAGPRSAVQTGTATAVSQSMPEVKAASTARRPTVIASPPESPSSNRSTLRVAPLLAGGVGVVAVTAGIYFSIRAHSLEGQVANAKQFSKADDSAGETAHTLQFVMYGLGAAALVTAGVLADFYYASARSSEHSVAVLPWATAGAAGATMGGRF
jgi:PEGA domain/Tetratricopeptide repeat